MLVLFVLFSVTSVVLSGVSAGDKAHFYEGDLNNKDAAVGDIEQDRIGSGNSLSKIVLNLQVKLASQEKRIKLLEARDKHRKKLVKKVTLKLTALEKRCGHHHQEIPGQNRKHVEKENYNSKGKFQNVELNDRKSNQDIPASRNFRRQSIRQITNVAFTAYLDHSVAHMGPGHTIKMNRVLLNDGNGYNPLTGIFTTPVSGVYMFNYHYNGHYTMTILRLIIDGVESVDAIASPQNSNEEMGGNTAVVRVTEGQSVWLENMNIDAEIFSVANFRYCTISGVLLYQ